MNGHLILIIEAITDYKPLDELGYLIKKIFLINLFVDRVFFATTPNSHRYPSQSQNQERALDKVDRTTPRQQ